MSRIQNSGSKRVCEADIENIYAKQSASWRIRGTAVRREIMDKVDIVIIGAGVVGLAIAYQLSKMNKEIILLEKHEKFGMEASSRNSEVIHAGIYYPEVSLKARFCIDGNHLLYELCKKYNIPHKKTGKLIVANTKGERENVESLYQQGKENGVSGLELLSEPQIKNLEPNIQANFALLSCETGIIDTHQLMKFYETQSESNDVIIAYQSEVAGIQKNGDFFTLDIFDSNGELFQIVSSIVINSAGIFADKIASMAGIDIDKAGYRIHPCKGEYFSISNRHSGTIEHLIYPTPSDINLGIHATLRLDGTLTLGPSAFYVNDINYDVDVAHQEEFFNSTKRFLPFLDYDDLSPEMSGIRAKLQAKGEPFRDFIIQEESEKGLIGLINLIGIESPGLTSAPAIAEYVEEIVNNL